MSETNDAASLKVSDAIIEGERVTPRKAGIGFLISIVVGILLFTISFNHLSLQGRYALAITGFAIVMWLYQVLPVEITSILVCALFVLFNAAPPAVAFGGFANPVTWFILAALVYGIAIHVTGIGKRIAVNIMRFTGTSFLITMIGVLFTGFVLCFVTPAGVERMVILFSIVIGLATAFGMTDEEFRSSNACKVAMGVAYLGAQAIAGGIMTSQAPNIIAQGLVKGVTGTAVSWFQWLIWLEVPAIVATGVSMALLWVVFKPEKIHLHEGKSYVQSEIKKLGRFTPKEKRTALYLIISLILWVTGNITNLPPWVVAIFIAGLFVAPAIGVIDLQDLRRAPVSVVIFSGAAISVGLTLLHAGVGDWIGKVLFGSVIRPGMSMPVVGALTYLVSTISHIPLIEGTTMSASFIPVVGHYFKSVGISALGPSLMAAMASDNIAFFPAMSLPMLLLIGFGYLSYKDSIKILSVFSVVSIIINILAAFTWYHWLGLM